MGTETVNTTFEENQIDLATQKIWSVVGNCFRDLARGEQEILCQDILGHVFLQINSGKYKAEGNFEHWVSRVAKRKALNIAMRGPKPELGLEAIENFYPENCSVRRPTEDAALSLILAAEGNTTNQLIKEILSFALDLRLRSTSQYNILMAVINAEEETPYTQIIEDAGMKRPEGKAALHRLRATLNEKFGETFRDLFD